MPCILTFLLLSLFVLGFSSIFSLSLYSCLCFFSVLCFFLFLFILIWLFEEIVCPHVHSIALSPQTLTCSFPACPTHIPIPQFAPPNLKSVLGAAVAQLSSDVVLAALQLPAKSADVCDLTARLSTSFGVLRKKEKNTTSTVHLRWLSRAGPLHTLNAGITLRLALLSFCPLSYISVPQFCLTGLPSPPPTQVWPHLM